MRWRWTPWHNLPVRLLRVRMDGPRFSIGDRIHVVVRGPLENGRCRASSDDVPDGWMCEFRVRERDAVPELGREMFARILDVLPDRRLLRLGDEFGFEHLHDRRREEYLGALECLTEFIRRGPLNRGRTNLGSTSEVETAISGTKGLFVQCYRRNQPCWFRVWLALGKPSYAEAKQWEDRLVELRKAVGQGIGNQTSARAIEDIFGGGFVDTLDNAIRAFRDEGRSIAGAKPIGSRTSNQPLTRRTAQRKGSSQEAMRRKQLWASATHEGLIQDPAAGFGRTGFRGPRESSCGRTLSAAPRPLPTVRGQEPFE